jgi:ferredoxin/flavodoxin---NADP+ reductase
VELYKAHIISHTILGNKGHLLRLPMLFDFKPGQVAGLGLKDLYPPRIYSFAGSDFKTWVEFLFDVRPGGFLSPRLAKLKTGDEIFMTKPFGAFLGTKEPACWIAAGTGIAPFKTMLDAGLHENKMLIHGVREPENFYFSDVFEKELQENYIRCCSGSDENGFFHGRVTAYLKQLPELPDNVQYFLCGSAEMVVDTRDLLISRGVPFERIVAEIYF